MLLSELIENFKKDLKITNFKDYKIEGIQSDSRLIKKNNIFFALEGIKSKGIDFADKAVENGAVVVVCSDKEAYKNDKITVIKCDDIIEIFGKFLNTFYPEKPEHIIGVTGTSGKTSVVEFFRQTIQKLGKDAASIGTLGVNFENSHLKEDTLTMRELVDLHEKLNYLKKVKKIDYVAMEFTSQAMHQRRSEGIKIEVAAFNNITPEHLDYHETMDEYLKQKMRIFSDVLKKGGTAVLNADIPEFEKIKNECIKNGHPVLSYGFNGDIKILNIKTHFKGQTVDLEYNGKKYVLNTPFIGKFQVMNLLATLAIVISMKIELSIEKIIKVLETIKQAEGRMELAGIKKNGAIIYVDFAHKPDALQKILETMREHISHDKEARLGVLFGCGGERDKTKRPVMGKIANDLADFVFITDDNPRTEDATTIRSEIKAACPKGVNISEGRKYAIIKALDMLQPKDILILAGKGHEKYTIIGTKQFYFSEFEIVQDYLKNENK